MGAQPPNSPFVLRQIANSDGVPRISEAGEFMTLKCRIASILFAALGTLLICPQLWPQTPDEVEKRIAALPPAERAYERFRGWITSLQLPPEQHQPDKVEAMYRDYLKSRGFSNGEIDTQIRLIEEQGERTETERWNRILTAENPSFNTRPNAFLVETAKSRKPGTALDVGMGQGRNSIWLAQQGWDVTGFDPAE
jgi:hypothetical protein